MQDTETFLIKVCGITSIEDGQAAVKAGANALGFNFYSKSPRYIAPAGAREIGNSIRGSYLRVGVFVNASLDELSTTAELAKLDVLQLHGEKCVIPQTVRYRIWRAIPGERPAVEPNDAVEAYLLDTATSDYGGSGRTFRWELASGFKQRVIIAGGLDGSNVAAAIEALHPWGVDACSRLESLPGKKAAQRVQAFVQAARQALIQAAPQAGAQEKMVSNK